MRRSYFFVTPGILFDHADITDGYSVGCRWSVDLLWHRGYDVFQSDCASGTLSKSAFVKEFFDQWRNDLSLKTIIMDFPRTRTSKKTDTSHLAAQCQMHWKSVTANKTSMIPDITQVLKKR